METNKKNIYNHVKAILMCKYHLENNQAVYKANNDFNRQEVIINADKIKINNENYDEKIQTTCYYIFNDSNSLFDFVYVNRKDSIIEIIFMQNKMIDSKVIIEPSSALIYCNPDDLSCANKLMFFMDELLDNSLSKMLNKMTAIDKLSIMDYTIYPCFNTTENVINECSTISNFIREENEYKVNSIKKR